MSVSVNFNDLFDRVEKHIGKRPTKLLIFTAWLAAICYFLNLIFGFMVKPLVDGTFYIRSALSWLDVLNIIMNFIIGAGMASWALDAYRIRMLRDEYEEVVGRAEKTLDKVRDFNRRSSEETDQLISNATSLVNRAKKNVIDSAHLKDIAVLVAESMLGKAKRQELLTEDELLVMQQMLDEIRRIDEGD